MPLPEEVQLVTVNFGPFPDFLGAPLKGETIFAPSTEVKTSSGVHLVAAPLRVVWDETGSGSITLPATDSTGLDRTGFTYGVTHRPHGSGVPAPRGGSISLPAAAPVVDLEDLLDTEVSPGIVIAQPALVSVGGLTGAPTAQQLVDALDVPLKAAFPRRGDVTRPATSPAPPLFQRQGPILTTAQAGSASVYWPYLVDMSGVPGAVARWYLYWSLDHSVAGGVYLKTADTLAALFNPAAGTMRGLVYVDTTAGSQTETATVLVVPDDPNGLPIYLYYQQKDVGTNQSTCLARSADGITFTRYGVVIEKQYASPGDGSHTYAHVHRFGDTFVAHHLNGQGDWGGMGISWSHDGLRWRVDPRRLTGRPDLTGDNGKRLDWHSLCLFQWRGRLWGTFGVSNLVSGSAIADTVQHVAPVAPDLRNLAGLPIPATTGLLPGETSAESFSSVVEDDGILYALYRSGAATGSINYATAVA